MINHSHLLKIKKVISNKLAEYLISRIVSGKIKKKKLNAGIYKTDRKVKS